MKPPIYEPKGKAKEYGDLALNIYTGCPHHCYYCYAPSVLHKEREAFHSNVEPRPGIVEEVRKQLKKENITGKLIHLCFTCDPYPTGHDTTVTREIIKLLKSYGNHVQILTKGDGSRDFDLLDSEDWYGITISGGGYDNKAPESGAIPTVRRYESLLKAHLCGIKTWVSFEPVLNEHIVLFWAQMVSAVADKIMVGKLNYHPSDIDWAAFGRTIESQLKAAGVNYYIKDSLREEMRRAE